jgi:hypothetical protein
MHFFTPILLTNYSIKTSTQLERYSYYKWYFTRVEASRLSWEVSSVLLLSTGLVSVYLQPDFRFWNNNFRFWFAAHLYVQQKY